MKHGIMATNGYGKKGRLPGALRRWGAGTALVLALGLTAQARSGEFPGGPGGAGGPEGPGGAGLEINPRMLRELHLAPDQEKKLKEARLAAQKRKIQLFAEKATLELDLKNALSAYPVNKPEALKVAEKIADVDKKMLLLRVETMSQLLSGLTAEQHAKLMAIQEEWQEKRRAWKEEMRKERMEGRGGKDGDEKGGKHGDGG